VCILDVHSIFLLLMFFFVLSFFIFLYQSIVRHVTRNGI